MATMATPTAEPDRVLLRDVPRVAFYNGGPRCPEDLPFTSCVRAWLEYVDDGDFGCRECIARSPNCKITCTNAYLLGTSGAAFSLSWGEGWQEDNVEITHMSDDPEAPFRRAFESVGYPFEFVSMGENGVNAGYLRQRIVESIRDRGRPVIALGIVGPPEACLVTGYDEGGDVLMGWSFFQDFPPFNEGLEYEPTGEFCARQWAGGGHDLRVMVVGDKQGTPNLGAVCRHALRWALQVMRTPRVTAHGGVRHNGLAAYDAWAGSLLRDDDFPAHDEATLRARHDVHNNLVGYVAEARWYGSVFLTEIVQKEHVHYDMAEELLHAAACLAAEHEIMWKAWNLLGGNGHPDAWRRLADPATRREMAAIVRRSAAKCAQTVDWIERALEKDPDKE